MATCARSTPGGVRPLDPRSPGSIPPTPAPASPTCSPNLASDLSAPVLGTSRGVGESPIPFPLFGEKPLASCSPFWGSNFGSPELVNQTEALHQLRRAFYAASRMLPVDLPDHIALVEQRGRILDLAAALLDLADAMDASAAELEPDALDDDGEAEESAQPATLCPDRVPVRRNTRGRRIAA